VSRTAKTTIQTGRCDCWPLGRTTISAWRESTARRHRFRRIPQPDLEREGGVNGDHFW
jgi:hypothetical protein